MKMEIISPPNSHPFCQEAKELASKIADTIKANGYEAYIQVDPYTCCNEREVNINCKVRLKTKMQ